MKRLLALLIVTVACGGCRCHSPPAMDPFLGRTRVAPPGTGSISAPPADPYYPGSPQVVIPQTPVYQTLPYQTPAHQAPSPAPSPAPPDYRGSAVPAIKIPTPSGPTGRVAPPSIAGRTSTGGSHAVSPVAGRQRVIRILSPRPDPIGGSLPAGRGETKIASELQEPRRLNVPTRVINIMDLPKAGTSASIGGERTSPNREGFQLVSSTQSPGDSSGVVAAAGSSAHSDDDAAEFAPRASYGYASDYAWVRGKLEYSQIDRRWKLRYIPVDGKTDKYGGSIILADAAMLTGSERGDFVEVRGQVGPQDLKKGFAPTYDVAEVKRLP